MTKISIKNVQARLDFELYENIQDIIEEFNNNLSANQEKLNLQKVIVEALNAWARKNRKDSLLSLSGLIKK